MARIFIVLLVLIAFFPAYLYAQEQVDEQKTESVNTPSINTSTEQPAQEEATSATDPKNFTNAAVLRGLNKITARASKINIRLNEPIRFGNLNIKLHACWKSPPEEEPESKALLEVWEEISGEPRKKIFSGWMFASSPLLSAPEHPVYDITLLECVN